MNSHVLAIAHLRAAHHGVNVVAVSSSGLAGASISGSDAIGLLSALLALVSIVLGIAATNAKKIRDAEERGARSRDEEVARVTQWMEFYRQNYANLLQQRAGAQVQPLPPQMTPGVAPPGQPPTPMPQLPPVPPPQGAAT